MVHHAKFLSLFTLSALAALCFPPSVHAEYYCSNIGNTGFYLSDPPSEITFAFIVKPGVPCPKTFRSGSTAMLKDFIYQKDAKHGTVTLTQSGAVYTANRDYHGPDSFALRVCGTFRDKYGCGDITYSITVE